MTVSSVIGWLSMSDLGMGNHLTTALAHATGTSEFTRARRETTAVFWAIAAICVALSVAAGLLIPIISWGQVFNAVGLVSERELTEMVAAFTALTIGGILTSLVYRVFDAFQEGWKVNAYTAASSGLSLVGLVFAVRLRSGLPVLAAAMLGPQVLLGAIASFVTFRYERPGVLGGFRSLKKGSFTEAARSGGWYFLVGLQSLFWLSKDNLMISRLLGPEHVGSFNTSFRVLFSLMGLLGARIGQSLWPAYAEAIGSGHWEWIRSAYRRTTIATILSYGASAALFAAVSGPLIKLWAGSALVTPQPVVWALAGEFTVLCWLNLVSYLLMAAGQPKTIAISLLLGGAFSIALGYWLMRALGLVGLPLANLVSLGIFGVLPLSYATNRLLGEGRGSGIASAEASLAEGASG
jgi:O-antigen/teichoic acid export membrane protein